MDCARQNVLPILARLTAGATGMGQVRHYVT